MKTRVLVSVMTYPTFSENHIETVCTAGFKENGEWIRIYPVPHRLLYKYNLKAYKKWQWIEVDLEKNPRDDRPESCHIVNVDTLTVEEGRITDWDLRREWCFKNKPIYRNMTELIQKAKNNEVSLAVVKPTIITDLTIHKVDEKKLHEKLVKAKRNFSIKNMQLNLFEDREVFNMSFNFAEQIPYKFKYVFYTEDGKERNLMIEDWEIIMLYLNCRKKDSHEIACQKVKNKYMDMAKNKDVYLLLGTTYEWQKKNAPDPFVIVGVFSPPIEPKIKQLSFDF